VGAAAAGSDRLRAGYARGRERDEAIRAGLEPLAPGERPRSVTVAAVVAAALGLVNVAGYLSGVRVQDAEATLASVLIFGAVMLALAAGMWRGRYWAVLSFEVLLGVSLVVAALSLLRAANALGVLVPLVVLGACGALFWKLIRAMARLQMPRAEGGS
jgi:hypothetical protein